jgi:small subunit ribosomal protein S8
MHQDTISDYLTRIRNALMVYLPTVKVPYSKICESISKILLEEGFIASYAITGDTPQTKVILITLKYTTGGFSVIKKITRVSKPGLRKYYKAKNLPKIMSGSGIIVVSTSQGILTDRVARSKNIGGEPLCTVY